MEETIRGRASITASHWAEKSGGVASPAFGATAGPKPPRNVRRRASCPGSRTGAGSGIHRLIWNGPAARTASAQARIAAGCISSAPQAPSPPARITATESAGGQAPAIGASSSGRRRP